MPRIRPEKYVAGYPATFGPNISSQNRFNFGSLNESRATPKLEGPFLSKLYKAIKYKKDMFSFFCNNLIHLCLPTKNFNFQMLIYNTTFKPYVQYFGDHKCGIMFLVFQTNAVLVSFYITLSIYSVFHWFYGQYFIESHIAH